MKIIVKLNLIFLVFLYSSKIFAATTDSQYIIDNTTLLNTQRELRSKSYSARMETRAVYGNERSLLRPMLLFPLIQSPYKITYLHVIFMADTIKNIEGNIGFGARWMQNKYILGGFGHFDYRETKNKNHIKQITLGLEFFQEFMEYRLNTYIPFQDKSFVSSQTIGNGEYSSVTNSTTYTTYKNNVYEINRFGLDIEAGGQLPQHDRAAGFLRVFYFHHGTYQKIFGAEFRISYRVWDWLSLIGSYNASNSNQQNNHYFAGLNLIGHLDSRYSERLDRFSRKMLSMPIRDLDIYTEEQTIQSDNITETTVSGRGFLIQPYNNEGQVVVNAVGHKSVDELNKYLNVNGSIEVDHLAIFDKDGKIYLTNARSNANTMLDGQMMNNRIYSLDRNKVVLGGTLDNLIRDPEEKRRAIHLIRDQQYLQTVFERLKSLMENRLGILKTADGIGIVRNLLIDLKDTNHPPSGLTLANYLRNNYGLVIPDPPTV